MDFPQTATEGGALQDSATVARRWEGILAHIMTSTPLFFPAVGMMSGIVAAERYGLGAGGSLALLSLASISLASPAVRRRFSCFLVLAAGVAMGGLMHWSREQCTGSSGVERIVEKGPVVARIRGRIASEPYSPEPEDSIFRPWQFRGESTSFLFRTSEVESRGRWWPVQGRVKVTVREAVLDVVEGDRVELFGRLVGLEPPANPGAFDWRGYYRQQGVEARLLCDQRENVLLLEREGPGFASWLKAKARGLLTSDIAASAVEESSLLEAMVLGHRSRFDRRLNEVFTRAGCVHFIAASGTNIVILIGAMWLVGRLAGLDHRQCAWLMIAGIVLYGLIAEARPPILRACVMGVMFCLAILFQRASSHLNWICAAAILLCLFDPLTVFDVGFQLSFAAVLGVAYLAPAILHASRSAYWWVRETVLADPYARADLQLRIVADKFSPISRGRRAGRWALRFGRAIAVVCAVSLGAWLITAPITATWFQQVQPWGVLSSVLVYPMMSAVMVLGIAKAALAAVSPTLAGFLTGVLGGIDAAMIWLVEKLAVLPGATPSVSMPPWWVVASYYLFLLTIVLAFRTRPKVAPAPAAGASMGKGRRGYWLLGSLLPLAAGCVAWRFDEANAGELRVTVLAVGAGSAVVIELPGGETVLYDAGSSGVGSVGKNVIVPFLRQRGIRHLDRIYLSHPDMDHFSGVPELIAAFSSGPILVNSCFHALARPRSPAAKLIEHVREANHPLEAIKQAQWSEGLVSFESYWPGADCSSLTANDSSTVLKISYGGHSILLTGDISERAQRALMEKSHLQADVLLLPHHGTVCSTTASFLEAVNASIFVRSSHEHDDETLNGLMDLTKDGAIYNTADCGAVTVTMHEGEVRVETWLDCKRNGDM